MRESPDRLPRTADRLRVIIADRDPLARGMLRRLVQDSGMTVPAEAASCQEAVELTAYYRPDVLLLDYALPDGTATDVLERLSVTDAAEVCVVVLSMTGDDATALDVLRAGAQGCLDKASVLTELPRALVGAVNGEAAVTRRFTRVLIDEVRSVDPSPDGMRPVRSPLSQREWEIVELLRASPTDADISAALGVSTATVQSHLRRMKSKLGVRTCEELVEAALHPEA